jgi:LysR family transcriptional regulator, glycine cleavage system transcriptional activator
VQRTNLPERHGLRAMKRLPPLTAVEAFVQVARLGSIKAAAESLALSSPALSRRVQALERHVGRPLFERRHQAVLLNPDGAQLLAEIGPALEELGHAMERAAGQAELMRLKLAVLPLFASYRLMPRLGELRQLHPDLHIDIDTRPHALARLDEGLDAAIALAREVDPSLYSVKLGTNRVVAVGGDAALALTDPAQLASATVLLHRDLPDAFDYWREAAGLPDLQPAAIDHFDSGQLILDAAAQGLGIAFMFEMHVEGAHDPRLHRLFDLAIESPYAYWFACRRSALGRRPVRIFHDWLVGELVGALAP